jgi:hypothetical protein
MSPPLRSLFRLCLLGICLCSSLWLGAQEDSSAIIKAPRLGRGVERDPKLLVEALTEGKTGDVEKFDAIFSWVASNIHYDYRVYFSGEGSNAETDVKRVLRRKRAICFQYAALMDQLCELADIHNVTVTGYAKDQLFDVNDTLYFDNHAWNAVKLDDRWYLYDVTWSAGGYEWRLTRFSKRIVRWRESIYTKRRKLRKEVIKVRVEGNEFCDIKAHTEKKERFVMKLPFFWRVVDRVLSRFKMRYVIDYGKVKTRDFYLTDPDLFAITHFPNVPYWSLTSGVTNVREFAGDSAYYHLEKDQYLDQEREGRMCLPCDDFFALEPLEQEKHTIRQSLANNPRNGLYPATAYFNIADIFFRTAEGTTDSLEKVSSYDSTLFYLQQARIELKRCNPQNTAFHRFHFSKETQKVKQVREANKAHTAVNIANVTDMRSRANKVRLMGNKMSALQRKYTRNYRTLERFRPKAPSPKVMKEGTAAIIQERIDFHENRIDSLDERIETLEASLIDRIVQLSDNVWEQSSLLNPQQYYFRVSIYARSVRMLDNRDKSMVQLHDSIRNYEESLTASIGQEVLLPCDTLYAEFRELEKCSRFRDADQLKTLKLYGQLYVGNVVSLQELEEVRARYMENDKRDYCYYFQHKLPMADFAFGFSQFRKTLYGLYKVIKADTKAETFRHKAFIKEILLTKKRVRSVISSNLKYQAAQKKAVMKAKREYIKAQKALYRD